MKKHFLLTYLTFILIIMGSPSFSQPSDDELDTHLRSRIHYTDKIANTAHCRPLYPLGKSISEEDKRLKNKINIRDITVIEVIGDQITLPTPMIIEFFLIGTFTDEFMTMKSSDEVTVKAYLKNNNCFDFTFFPNVMGAHVLSGSSTITAPYIYKYSIDGLSSIKKWITRSELEKIMHVDSGISSTFHFERYVLNNAKNDPPSIKLNIAFKPAGMSDAIYLLGKWNPPKQSPDDTIFRLSPPYSERSTND
jgi:hypothetical protein